MGADVLSKGISQIRAFFITSLVILRYLTEVFIYVCITISPSETYMYYSQDVYGASVILTYFALDGVKPDGSAYPGADIQCMVRFDPAVAGCNLSTGYCDPGAQVAWYVNGVLMQDTVWSGYNPAFNGYVATFRFYAPSSGSVMVTAESANTVQFPIDVSEIDQLAGKVTNHSVTCAANSNPAYGEPCPCEGGELLLGYSVNVTNVGNGMAYLHVFIDGAERYQFVTTTYDQNHGGIVAIPCPPDGTHSISIRGDDDIGATVSMVIGDGGSTCLYYPCYPGCPDSITCGLCGNAPCGDECITNPCTYGCPDYSACGKCGNAACASTDVFEQIIAFLTENPSITIGCAAAVGLLLLSRK
jgi:hypothetical protein